MKHFRELLKRAFAFVLALAIVTGNLETDVLAADANDAVFTSYTSEMENTGAETPSDPSVTDDSTPEESNPEESNPEESNPEDGNPEDGNPEDIIEPAEPEIEEEVIDEDIMLTEEGNPSINLILMAEDECGHILDTTVVNNVTQAVFDYNQSLTLSLLNLPDGNNPQYVFNDDVLDGATIAAPIDPGVYDVRYYVTINEVDYTVEAGMCKVQIQKAPLANVSETGMGWTNGSVANWNRVIFDKNGKNFSGNCNYKIKLYRDNELVTTEPVNITGGTAETFSYDFKDLMTAAGEYTFSVSAVPDSTMSTYYTDSEQYVMSTNAKAYAAAVTLTPGLGISTVSPQESFVLVAGGASEVLGFNKASIAATPISGWDFGEWKADSDTGVTIKNSTSANAEVVLDNACTCTAVNITATGSESNAPVIDEFIIKPGDKESFRGFAVDSESGLSQYAFSTSTTAPSNDSSEWNDWPEMEAFASGKPSESGDYYFYVKDKCGNVAKSENSIHATKITYNDYYVGNVCKDDTVNYRLGDENASNFVLPACVNGDKSGYRFIGWYDNPDYLGDAITSVSVYSGTDTFVAYAKWKEDLIQFKTELQPSVNVTYSGTNVPLTVEMEDFSGTISYEWFKFNEGLGEYVAIPGETSSTLNLRNVSDSGQYKVVASGESMAGHQSAPASSETTVTISKASLTINIDDKEIHYRDPEPQYTVTYTGLVGTDVSAVSSDPASVFSVLGVIVCEGYAPDKPVKDTNSWPLTFATEYESENYVITSVPGTLSVTARDASNAEIALLNGYEYQYCNSLIRPAHNENGEFDPNLITVSLDGVIIPADEYTVSYKDNLYAADADDLFAPPTVIVTFGRTDGQQSSYTGTAYKTFSITRKPTELEVSMQDWEYNGESGTPVLLSSKYNASPIEWIYTTADAADLTLENKASWDSLKLDESPANAGDYKVYAYQSADQFGYAEAISAPVSFTISRKKLIFTAKSNSWTYDGSSHSDADYTQSGEPVLDGESVQSVVVTGTITNVDASPVANTIKVTLSSSTNAANYEIVEIPGELTITPQTLPAPGNIGWVNSDPGKLSWIAVYRQGLTVNYKVALYEIVDGVSTLVHEDITSATSYDFKEIIQNRINADTTKSYAATVTTLVNTDVHGNYSDSEPSTKSGELYTATVYAKVTDNVDQVSISVSGGEPLVATEPDSSVGITLIKGQSVNITATPSHGYAFNKWETQNSGLADYVSFGDNKATSTTVTLTNAMTSSNSSIVVVPTVGNENPKLTGFEYDNDTAAHYSHVDFTVTFSDTLGLTEWFLYKNDSLVDMYLIDSDKITEEGGIYSYTESIEITDSGKYTVGVKDDTNEVTRFDNSFIVYKIAFDKGDGDAYQANPMSPIFKIENTTITLPTCTFTKEGNVIKNWVGANTGISADGGQYAANKSDTLVATWTDEQISYTVEYYYMTSDGTYNSVPDTTANFVGGASAVISYDKESIQKSKTNYERDDAYYVSASIPMSITLNTSGKVLKLYYRCQKHKIIYWYRDPITNEKVYYNNIDPDTQQPIPDTYYDEYYYGKEVTIRPVPTMVGYDFVGWVFEAGNSPSTMPAQDIEATGSFVAHDAKYKVVYYERNLNTLGLDTEVGFIHAENLDEELNALHNSQLTFTQDDAQEIEGFTLEAVVVSKGAPTGTECIPQDATLVNAQGEVSVEGTVSVEAEQTLYVNCYYSRNKYNLTIDVWRDNRETPTNRWFHDVRSIEYGENIEELSEAAQDPASFTEDDGIFKLAGFEMPSDIKYRFTSYTDYSTGDAPDTMPAGNVTITKDIIPAVNAQYKIRLYFESSTIGKYDLKNTIAYDAPIGSVIHVVEDDDTRVDEGSDYYVKHSNFLQTVTNADYYTHIFIGTEDALGNKSVEEGEVLEDGSLVLDVYFERKTTTADIRFYCSNSANTGTTQFASYKISGKWGTNYEFDPAMLFDSKTEADVESNSVYTLERQPDNTITQAFAYNDASKRGYDFKSAHLVSFQDRYDYFDSNSIRQNTYPQSTFLKVGTGAQYLAQSASNAGLGDIIKGTFGVTSAYSYVYYTKVEEDEDFYLDLRINSNSGLNDKTIEWWVNNHGGMAYTYPDGNTLPAIYYEYNGIKYPVRAINKCAIVNGVKQSGSSSAEYPAIEIKTRSYDYTGINLSDSSNLHAGFTYIGGDYFYYDGSVGDDSSAYGSIPCVYKALSNDPFMHGAYAGYSLSGQELDLRVSFMNSYIADHQEGGPATLDSSATALYCTNSSWSTTFLTGTYGTLNVTFGYRGDCSIYYYLNGNSCTNSVHSYVYGTKVPKERIKCDHIGTPVSGYEVVWYRDAEHTIPIPEAGITMTSSIWIYGQYEKSTITNMDYVYYQLANPVIVGGNPEYYITEELISELNPAALRVEEGEPFTLTISDGDKSVDKTCHTRNYYYDDELVMIEKEHPSYSYKEITLINDYPYYQREGFYYDKTNTNNRNKGYVNTDSLKLRIFYARNSHQVTVDPNISENDNMSFITYRIGQTVNLSNPVNYVPERPGYTFDSWEWYKELTPATETTAATYEKWENPDWADPQHETVKMPGVNIKAEAKWQPAEFVQDIYYYFQRTDRSYNTDFINSVSGASSVLSVTYNGTSYSARVYGSEPNYSAAVITMGTGDNAVDYYFSRVTVSGGQNTLNESDLVAAKCSVSMTSDDSLAIDAYKLSGFGMFGFDLVNCQYDSAIVPITSGDFDVKYGMKIGYYYARTADYNISLIAKATDGEAADQDHGITLTGDGEYYYGQNATLNANIVAGFTFVGWYAAADVLEGYPYSGLPLSAYSLSENWQSATPKSTEVSFTTSVTGAEDYVAIVTAKNPTSATLTVSGTTLYTYGYTPDKDNPLSALVVLGESAEKDKTGVSQYKWYRVLENGEEEAIYPDGESSTYLFPAGKSVGDYTYRCKVTLRHADSGRTEVISSEDITVRVQKKEMSVKTEKFTGTFDLNPHTIKSFKVDVRDENIDTYEVYMSAEHELDETNYLDGQLITNPSDYSSYPQFVNVNHEGDVICPHTVYFYVKDTGGNYKDYKGSELVDIIPRQVTVTAISDKIFEKEYDASDMVNGSVTDPDSDLYEFTRGRDVYYTLNGLYPSDSNFSEYVLACNARYNSMHVVDAKTFTVSDMYIINRDESTGEKVYDYAFPDSNTLVFTGTIKAKELSIKWNAPYSFEYDGKAHSPEPEILNLETDVPAADQAYIRLDTTGKQTNVGTGYVAYVVAQTVAEALYKPSDYVFSDSESSHGFEITKRNIKVKAIDDTVIYDGNQHTLNDCVALHCDASGNEIPDSQGATEGLVKDNLSGNQRHTMTYTKGTSYVERGVYDGIAMSNIVIRNSSGHIMNDNYNIVASESGTLTINPSRIYVDGITAESKDYDSTTEATLILDNIVFHAIEDAVNPNTRVETDELDLLSGLVSGAFTDASVGIGKTVIITISEGALSGAGAENYELVIGASQASTTADIRNKGITVKANPLEITYGQTADFTCRYSELPGGEDPATEFTGTPVYEIKTGTDTWVTYVPGSIGVGTYPVRISNPEELSTAKYVVSWDDDESAVLTVKPRPIAVQAVETANITKEYDGSVNVINEDTIALNSHYRYATVENKTESGIFGTDTVNLSWDKAEYNSKNVTADKVTLSGLTVDNDNYVLDNESVDITGTITPKSLTITASNVSVEYGEDPASKFGVTYSGFISADGNSTGYNAGVLTGTLSYQTATFDRNDAANRHVGTYTDDIRLTGLGDEGTDNGNYTIHYVPATLTVTPATITVYATSRDDSTSEGAYCHYKVGNVVNGTPNQTPELTHKAITGFKYAEDAALIDDTDVDGYLYCTEDGTASGTPVWRLSLPNTNPGYPIRFLLNEDGTVQGISYDSVYNNYKFMPEEGHMQVDKYTIKVTGITLGSKVYDGTTKIADNLDLSGITFENIDPEDQAYIDANRSDSEYGINIESLIAQSDYASKNVGTWSVNLHIELGSYLADRYTLDTDSQSSTTSEITARPITVKAKDMSKKYGSAKPNNYGVEEVPPSAEDPDRAKKGLVSGESLGSTYFTLPGKNDYTCAYSGTAGSYSNTGVYSVTPTVISAKNNNYSITILDTGKLTITKATLATPSSVSWNSAAPGTVNFSGVSGIGDVSVSGYEVILYKNGTSVSTVNVGSTDSSYDFANTIRTNGAGAYTVKVRAIASETNNSDGMDTRLNVKDSAQKASDSTLYAAEVNAVFAADAVTAAAHEKYNEPTVNGSASYVLIAGETNIPIEASIISASGQSGYTIKSIIPSSSEITLSTPVLQDDCKNITTTITNSSALAQATPITVTITMQARPATLTATLSLINSEAVGDYPIPYNYEAEMAPRFNLDYSVDGDNIGTDGYTYSFKFYRAEITKKNRIQPALADFTRDGAGPVQFVHPTGLVSHLNYYFMVCDVTATRLDNGQSITVTSNVVPFDIVKAKFEDAGVIMGDWEYGQKRKEPSLNRQHPEPEQAVITYLYSTNQNAGYTESIPTNVGNYYVKAGISATDNYDAVETDSKAFKITQAKLETPQNLRLTPSELTSSGIANWDAVAGPIENANDNNVHASSIGVKYILRLYYENNGNMILSRAINNITGTSCDISNYINNKYKFAFSVQAVSDNQTNCANSEESALSSIIDVAGVIEAYWKGNKLEEASSYTETYDGTALTLKVVFEGVVGEKSYQWYKNGQPIDGETNDSIDIAYVEQNGTYSCKISVGSTDYYSQYRSVTINPRLVKIATDSGTWTYDGMPHALNVNVADGDNDANWHVDSTTPLASGDTATLDFKATSVITNVGSISNEYENLVISKDLGGGSSKVVYSAGGSSNNYNVTPVLGTLTVNKKALSAADIEIDFAEVPDYMYDGTEHKPAVKVIDTIAGLPVEITEGSGEYDVSWNNNIYATTDSSKAHAVIKSNNKNYSGTVTLDFDISKRPITFETADGEWTYDGTYHTKNTKDDYTIKTDAGSLGLAYVSATNKDTEVVSFKVSSRIMDYTPTGVLNEINVIKIYHNGTDATSSYDITINPGTLMINKAKSKTTITNSLDKVYDGREVNNVTYTYTGTGTIHTTYYGKSGESWVMLSEKPKTAGQYKVEVTMDESNNYLPYNSEDSADFSAYKEFEITKRQITVTAKNAQRARYDSTPLTEPGYTVSGLNPALGYGDTLTATVSGELTHRGTADNVVTEVVIKNSAGEVTTDNYDIITKKGTLTIGQATPTINVSGMTVTYDGKTHGVIPNMPWGDGVLSVTYVKQGAPSVTLPEGELPVDIGTYMATVKSTETNDFEAGQVIVYVIITKRTVWVQAPSAEKVYDGHELKKWDGYSVLSTGDGLAVDSGDYIAGITYDSASKATNYTGTTVQNTITAITVKNSLGEDVTANYNTYFRAGTLKINQRPITIEAKSYTGELGAIAIYDSKEHKLTFENGDYTITNQGLNSGLADTDEISSLLFTTTGGPAINAGTYTVKPSTAGIKNKTSGIVANANYIVTYEQGSIEIKKRPITIAAGSKLNLTYTGNKVSVTFANGDYEITSALKIAENDSLSGLTLTGERTNVGQTVTTASAADIRRTSTNVSALNNYTITYVDGLIEIIKANQVITAENLRVVYDGTEHRIVATAMGDSVITYENNGRTVAGTQTVIIHAGNATNYNDAPDKEVTITIDKRPITVTADSDSKIYDGTPLTDDGFTTSDNLVNNGTIKHELSAVITGTITDYGTEANVVGDVVITETNLTTQETSNVTDNYEITKVNGVLTINKDEQQITVTPLTFDYDSSVHPIDGGTSYGTDLGYVHTHGDGTISITYARLEGSTETPLAAGSYPKNAGTYKVYVTALESENYNACTVTTTIQINKQAITVTADSLGLDPASPVYYDGTAHGITTYTRTGELKGSDYISAVNISSSLTDAGEIDNVIDSIVITSGGENVTDSYTVTLVKGRIKVTARPITIIAGSHSGVSAHVYDNTAQSLEASEYTVSVTDGSMGIATDTDEIHSVTLSGGGTDVGTYTTTASNAVIYKKGTTTDVTSNYNITYVSGTIEIVKKTLHIKAGSKHVVYDGNPVVLSVSNASDYEYIDGTSLASGDTLTGLTLTGGGPDAGTYASTAASAVIKHNGVGADIAANYEISYYEGSIVIDRAEQVITAAGIDEVYDGLAHTVVATALENPTITYSVSSGSGDGSAAETRTNAGTHEVLISTTETTNYKPATKTVSITIRKRPLEITAGSANKNAYDGVALTCDEYLFTGNTSLAQNESVYQHTITGSQTDCGESDNVPSDFRIKHGSLDSDDVTQNYEITYINGKLTVGVADQHIEVTPLTYEYNAGPHEVSQGTGYNHTVGDGTITVEYRLVGNGGVETILPSGTYPVRVGRYRAVISAASTGNYKSLEVSTYITITPRPVTIKAGSIGTDPTDPLYYDGQPHIQPLGWSVVSTQGLAIGDTISNVTCTAASSRIYAGSTPNVIQSVTIMDGTDDVTYCYTPMFENGEIKITKRPITITAGSHSGVGAYVYDNTRKSLAASEYVVSGLADTDEIYSVSLSGSGIDAGSYDTTVSNAIICKQGTTGNVTSSYDISYVPGTIEIRKRTLHIKAGSKTVVYDMNPVVLERTNSTDYEYIDGTSLANGDVLTGLTLTGGGPNAGTYASTASAASIKHNGVGTDIADKNYEITYYDGSIVINKADQVITADDIHVVYDGLPHTVSATAFENPTITYSVASGSGDGSAAETRTNAGTHTVLINAAENTNYKAAQKTVTIEITKRQITITAASDSKKYDGTPITNNGYTLGGTLVNSGNIRHELTVSVAPESQLIEVGTVKNIVGTVVVTETNTSTLDTRDVTANYEITKVDGSLSITKDTPVIKINGRPVMSGDDVTVEYDGTYHYIDAVTDVGLPVNIVYTAGQDALGKGQIFPGEQTVKLSVDGTDDYFSIDEMSVTLKVTKRALTITAASKEKVYDSYALTAPTFKITAGSVAAGQTLDSESVVVTGSQTEVGSSYNVIDPDSVHIKDASDNEVTQYYDIRLVNGYLTVKYSTGDDTPNTPSSPSNPDNPVTPIVPVNPIPIIVLPIIPGYVVPRPVPTVFTDIVDDGGDSEETASADEPAGENASDREGQITVFVETNNTPVGKIHAEVYNKQRILDAVMNDTIEEAIGNGDDVEVRLTVNPVLETEVPKEDADAIYRLITDIRKLGMFIDLKLDWRINQGEWINVPRIEKTVSVTIEIPEELRGEGREYYIAMSVDGHEEIFEDLDENDDTITISTGLFDASYAILYEERAKECYWHILILIMMLCSAGFALFLWKQDDEESKKVRRMLHIPLLIVCNGIGVVCIFLGHCSYDLPCGIICIAVTAVTEGISAYRYRDKNDSDAI